MSKGYLGIKRLRNRPKANLVALLKKLGLKEADYDFFVHVNQLGKVYVLVNGKWVESIGDVA